jgi:hypothetical protein
VVVRLVSDTPEDEILMPGELDEMHEYCKSYRDLVQSGNKPTPEQDIKFMRYQVICYRTGKWRER